MECILTFRVTSERVGRKKKRQLHFTSLQGLGIHFHLRAFTAFFIHRFIASVSVCLSN
jgi:hypothetical protein